MTNAATGYNPMGWIEIPATDLDRAEAFYGELFGYAFQRQAERDGLTMSWFPMGEDPKTPGASGALVKHEMYVPSVNGITPYFSVNRVDTTLETATKMGATVFMPKTDIGEHGFFAMLRDSEGNRICIHSMVG